MWGDDPELAECFLEHPHFPSLIPKLEEPTEQHRLVELGPVELVCFCQNDEDKICIMLKMLPKPLWHYHLAMVHIEGMSHLVQTRK